MDDKLRDEIVDGLVRNRSRSDIVEGVCHTTGLDWQRAEKLVAQVEAEQSHTIARGRLPIIVVLSAVLAAAGMFMLAFSLIVILNSLSDNTLLNILMLATRYRFPLIVGFLGLLVMVGSAIGLYQGLLRYFET